MKSFLFLLPILVAFLVLGVVAYIRLAPSDAATWHIDPTTPAAVTGEGRFLLRDGADAPSPVYGLAPDVLLTRLAEIAQATPRTQLLAGSPAEGRMTFITRSALMAFPDYTTVAAVPAGDGQSKLVIYARLRFGERDFGVNRARVELWLAALDAAAAS